jgi:cell division septation protein DedD
MNQNEQFGIQVASFLTQADADRMIERLRAAGFPSAYRSDEEIEGKGVRFRIKIGFYENKGDATAVMERLHRTENLPDAYVFKRK